ncbi:MAG: dihydrodipicolinate synthase family protein [Bdellovibrionota bacterium]
MANSPARNVFAGMIPALMTPTKDDGTPDLDQLVVVATDLVARGATGVVYAGSMGEWPLLSDEVRMEGVARLCAAGISVVVGTGHPNPRVAAHIAAHAKSVGAAGLMIIPRQSSRVSIPSAQRTHFASVLEAGAPLPAVSYNSPYYGYSMTPDMFRSLRQDHDNLVGFKEFGGANDLTRDAQFITSGDPDLSLLVGVDTQVTHGFLNCNAVGAITGIGNVFPEAVSYLLRLCVFARESSQRVSEARQLAFELERAMMELAKFDEGPDLVLYYKHLMDLAGVSGYKVPILPGDTLSPTQTAFATQQFAQFNTFWADWDGKNFLTT